MASYRDSDQEDEPRRSRPGRALGAAVLAAVLVWGVVTLAPLAGVRIVWPAGLGHTAERLGGEVATSATSLLPLGERTLGQAKSEGPRPHIVPTVGAAVHIAPQTFSYDGVRHTITPHVASSVYWGARQSTRLMVEVPGQSEAAWSAAYYRAFADDPAQKPAIDDVALQLAAIRDRSHLSSDRYLELIAKYVQSIPYDEKLWASGKGVQRFPVETLVDGTGLCGDKSVLLAVLLSHEGYSAALLHFPPEKHMAVGVRGPGTTYNRTGWLFVETTAPGYISDIPKSFVGGVTLSSTPHVIEVGAGRLQYGAARDIAHIIAVREAAQPAADALLRTAKRQSLTVAEAAATNSKLDRAYKATSSLQSNVVDERGRPVGKFMDRVTALAWIKNNAWWL